MPGFQDSFPTRMRLELRSLSDLRRDYRTKSGFDPEVAGHGRALLYRAYLWWLALVPLTGALGAGSVWCLRHHHKTWLPGILFCALGLAGLLHYLALRALRRYRESTPGHFVRGQARRLWWLAHLYPAQGAALFLAACVLGYLHVSALGWAGFAFAGPFLVFSLWLLYRRYVSRLYRDHLMAAVVQGSGAEGEAEAARLLWPPPAGWSLRFGVKLDGIGDLDILAQGPDGTAIIIEVKSHRGRIELSLDPGGRERLLRDGEELEPGKDFLRQIENQIRAYQASRKRRCRAILCFTRGRLQRGFPSRLGNVEVTEARGLRKLVYGEAAVPR